MQPAITVEWNCTRRVLLSLCLMAVAGPLSAQGADSTSWMRRPEIREIRSIVADVQRRIDNHSLATKDTTLDCDEYSGDDTFSVFTDRRGVIRRVVWSGAAEDHGEVNAFTYDSLGRLRFMFSDQSAVNGSDGEIRAYWSADGSLLHEDTRTTKGDGYPWATPRPILDPKRQLARPCEQ
jgi:hypothetical protein